MMFKRAIALILVIVVFSSQASAHYLWVIVDKTAVDRAGANVYFEEGPGPGDGGYLDQIMATHKMWVRTVEKPEPKLIVAKEVKQKKLRWLHASVADAAPRSIDTYSKFGVYRYGKTDVLLHYYARTLDVNAHEDLHELGRAEHMKLDIVPHDFGKRMTLTVLWQGKPVANRLVYLRGPKLKENVKTDDKGHVKFEMNGEGRYTFRTSVELDEAGKDNGKDYSLIRHHATLVMQLPLTK